MILHSDNDYEPQHISELIEKLRKIKDTYGDVCVSVTDTEGNKLCLTGYAREWADPDYVLEITAKKQ